MYQVSREIDFCYGHRLLNYEGKCRWLHGHNGRAVVTLEHQKPNHCGMVIDFTEIKQYVSTWIDEHLDHRMILHQDDPLLPFLRDQQQPLYIMDANPTAENIARLIFEQIEQEGYPVVEVRLWETPSSFATYKKPDPAQATGY